MCVCVAGWDGERRDCFHFPEEEFSFQNVGEHYPKVYQTEFSRSVIEEFQSMQIIYTHKWQRFQISSALNFWRMKLLLLLPMDLSVCVSCAWVPP